MLERIGGQGGGGRRERKKKGAQGHVQWVCHKLLHLDLNYVDWYAFATDRKMRLLFPPACLAPKWQSKTMSFRSYKSGWGESSTDNFHAELFKKGNRLTSRHHRWNVCLLYLLWSSQPQTFTVMIGSVLSPHPEGHQLDNHPTYPITIPSLIIFKLISKTRDIWVSA